MGLALINCEHKRSLPYLKYKLAKAGEGGTETENAIHFDWHIPFAFSRIPAHPAAFVSA